MKLNSARIAWHDAFYQPWDSVMAGAIDRGSLGIVEAGGWVERKLIELDDNGEQVKLTQWVFVPGVQQTRPERDISTGRAVHQALAAPIQKAIASLPLRLQAFGHHLYGPGTDDDLREEAETLVFGVVYAGMLSNGERFYAKTMARAQAIASGVLYRYRRMHQGGQSSMPDPMPNPEAFRKWLEAEKGVKLASESWGREWEPFVAACFRACDDLDKEALVPVSSTLALMCEAA
jgi:hypothetical protein